LKAGKPPETSAAIVRRCSWPDQRVERTTLERVPDLIAEKKLRPPVIVVIGDVTKLESAAHWFVDRSLFGRRILITRPIEQAGDSGRQLEDLGAEVLVQPAITIGPAVDQAPLDAAIAQASEFDWIVFSSANGVRHFFERLAELRRDARHLTNAKFAVIGPGTREMLATYHLQADLEPSEHRAEALAEALSGLASGQQFLLVRASRGREVLAESLRNAGGQITQVVAYESSDVQEPDAEIVDLLDRGRIDWITVTSSAIARSLVNLFGARLQRTRLASVSPITSATLRELGFEPAAEAIDYTFDGVVRAILANEASGDTK
jgi:uroporphyrinogen III methyltransferase/synthase